jgi:hypothetical protein
MPHAAVRGEARAVIVVLTEDELKREIAELAVWLAAQGLDVRTEHSRMDADSRDRLYWEYGYYSGMRRALAMLTNCGATTH